MLEAKCGGGGPNRDPAALQQADADEVADGTLYSVASVNLTGEVGNREGLRVGVQRKA
jgi:hypothetical protein